MASMVLMPISTTPTPFSFSRRSIAPVGAAGFKVRPALPMMICLHTAPLAGALKVTGSRTFCPGHHSQIVISTSFCRTDASFTIGVPSCTTRVSSVEASAPQPCHNCRFGCLHVLVKGRRAGGASVRMARCFMSKGETGARAAAHSWLFLRRGFLLLHIVRPLDLFAFAAGELPAGQMGDSPRTSAYLASSRAFSSASLAGWLAARSFFSAMSVSRL